MLTSRKVRLLGVIVSFVVAAMIVAGGAQAGPIAFGVWYEFQTLEFLPAEGCPPADPSIPPIFGSGCTPSPGTPTTFADDPPYTFVAPASGASLTVTDAFDAGDILDVFDFGVLIGTTSPSAVSPIHIGAADPEVALTDPRLSHGTFALGVGPHSITFLEDAAAEFDPTGVEGPGGAHFFRVSVAAPEPSSLTLVVGGFVFAAGLLARHRGGRAKTSV